jgi:hypothetical protein
MAFETATRVARDVLAASATLEVTDSEFVVLTVASGTATFQSSQDGLTFGALSVIDASNGNEVTSGGAGTYIVSKLPSGRPIIRATGTGMTVLRLS